MSNSMVEALLHNPATSPNILNVPKRTNPIRVSLLLVLCLTLVSCKSTRTTDATSITFSAVPPIGSGPSSLEHISGRVIRGKPGTHVVLYAHSKDVWWIQPFRGHANTSIASDGTWTNITHLGSDYAALLVRDGFQTATKLTQIPGVDDNILAVAMSKGSSNPPPPSKVIRFSGLEWKVRSSPNDRGGELCDYEAANVWVDEKDQLHIWMGPEAGRWHCASLSLIRSLGYGTYRFVLGDTSQLPASPVLAISTWSRDGGPEMGIELSHWGKKQNHNTDYVIQPYYVPENTVHFDTPPGVNTHVLRWGPGTATFRSFAGNTTAPKAQLMEHTFRSTIPVPSSERLQIDFYDFHHLQNGLQHPVEIIIEKFEYLP